MDKIIELENRINELENRLSFYDTQKPLLFTKKNTGLVTADKSLKIIVDGAQYQVNVL